MLLDTSFVIDLLRGRNPALEKIRQLEAEAIATSIAAPTIFELFVGISLTKRTTPEKKSVMDILESWGTLALDSECAALAGRIHGQLIREGQMVDPEDSMIAAIAIVNKETVLTKNKKHFERIPDVKVETY